MSVATLLAGCDGVDPADEAPSASTRAASAAPIDCTVVLYGDSILHGAYAESGQTRRHTRYPSAEIKAERNSWSVDDRTVSGQSLKLMAKAFERERRSSRIVVLGSGIAEGWSGADVTDTLTRLVEEVRSEGKTPVLTGYARQLPNAFMTADRLAGRDRADAEAREVAQRLGVEFSDFGGAGPVEIIDDVHPTQAYSLELTRRLVHSLDRVAPECARMTAYKVVNQ